MKKLKKMQRLRLENLTANLLDLFAQIARSLPDATVSTNDKGDTYSLMRESLRVDYTIQHYFQNGKTERLVISKEWQQENCVEKITIHDAYDDEKDWIVEEVIECLSLINNDSRKCIETIKGVVTPTGVPTYKTDFALDLAGMYYELRESKLEYFTGKISRGLQSLSALRMPQHVDWRYSGGEARVKRIFDKMLDNEEVWAELHRLTGRVDSKTSGEFLRSGKIQIDKAFTFSEKDSFSKWQDMTFELVWLCKYYAGIDMPNGLHDNEISG